MIRRVIACTAPALLLLVTAAVTGVRAVTPYALAAPGDNALQLLVIELFFLLVGLFVIAALGYLIWESRRKKREKKRQVKR